MGHAVIDQKKISRLEAENERLLAALNFARCPVCAGFDGKGENDRVHNKTCPVAKALRR